MSALVIHGGAGLVRRDSLTPEREADCRLGLERALDAGLAVLDAGGSALDAVTAAVVALEEDPLFNAGRGAVLAAGGGIELDAAIMEGAERRAGALAGVRTPRNPIRAARAVLEHSPHVMLAGAGGDAFITEQGLETVAPGWHRTPERLAQYQQVAGSGAFTLDHGSASPDVYGTVGAVAVDDHGHTAAATSTGGMVNKRPGRVGDSPLIGAGTFAWDRTCAVSGTGHGEPFIRLGVAGRVSALMELAGFTLQQAAERVIHQELPELEGQGGLIAVGADGTVAMPFNTGGMFRAWRSADGSRGTAIW